MKTSGVLSLSESRKLIAFLIFFSLPSTVSVTSTLVHAEEVNPFENQCDVLAHENSSTLTQLATNPDSFWSDVAVRSAYLAALNEGTTAGQSAIHQNHDAASVRAAVLLAGIVRHDLAAMQTGFSENAVKYFSAKSIFPPLTMAASCDFGEGVEFLLNRGLDPNKGSDVGSFNLALVNHDAVLARRILKAGYRIEANDKRCRSSKYIVEKNASMIADDVRVAVESSACNESSGSAKE